MNALVFFWALVLTAEAMPLFEKSTFSPVTQTDSAIVAVIHKRELTALTAKKEQGNFVIFPTHLKDMVFRRSDQDGMYPLCPSAYFSLEEKTGVHCSAVMVGPKKLVMAKHCLPNGAAEGACAGAQDLIFVPSYNGEEKLLASKIYRCRRLQTNGQEDYAVVELDRALPAGSKFFDLAQAGQSPAKGQEICLEGYPLTLRQRFRSCTQEFKLEELRLSAQLSSFQGQSGSPVFSTNAQGRKLLWGILYANNVDFRYDQEKSCLQLHACQDERDCYPSLILRTQALRL